MKREDEVGVVILKDREDICVNRTKTEIGKCDRKIFIKNRTLQRRSMNTPKKVKEVLVDELLKDTLQVEGRETERMAYIK